MDNIPSAAAGGIDSTMAMGSPKITFQLFYYHVAMRYFETLRESRESGTIDQATAALIALCCPDKSKREELWKRYTDIIEGREQGTGIGSTAVTASVLVVGDLTTYLNDVLEFTEKSYGAIL